MLVIDVTNAKPKESKKILDHNQNDNDQKLKQKEEQGRQTRATRALLKDER